MIFIFPLIGAFPAPSSGFDFTCRTDCGKEMQDKEIRSNLTEYPKYFLRKAAVRFQRISPRTVLDGMDGQ